MTPCSALLNGIGRFARDERGATTAEFAIIIGPFLFLLFAAFEIAFTFFVAAALDSATHDVARSVRTGEAQFASASSTDIVDAVCARIASLVSCDGNVFVDVQTFTDFASVDFNNPVVDGAVDPDQLTSNLGGGGEVVLMRVFLVWDTLVPDYLSTVDDLTGGQRLFVASAAFRNEPF
ncbi:MAG: pilus assembly protein [Caulobacterales bacterium]|nr:pilus assembly protein [Caulobacterales bacterium]